MSEIYAIKVGCPGTYRQLHTEGKYAVFEKTAANGSLTYIIGRVPEKTESSFQPASATREFTSEASATEALTRWASDPPVPKPAPKTRKPGACRRNSSRKRKERVLADQFDLDLSDPRRI